MLEYVVAGGADIAHDPYPTIFRHARRRLFWGVRDQLEWPTCLYYDSTIRNRRGRTERDCSYRVVKNYYVSTIRNRRGRTERDCSYRVVKN